MGIALKTLDQIAIECGTDRATVFTRTYAKPHGYSIRYDSVFTPFRTKPLKVLEIGAAGGEGIRMWLEYFQNAHVFGVDNNPDAFKGPIDRYTFVLGDQSCTTFWKCFIADYGSDWDIIIDDGGHFSGGIITTFESLWQHVKRGGIYAIEDLACAYSSIFQTPGFKSHMEFVKELVENANKGERDIHSITQSKELAILVKAP
jgi:demethylmacrocin O-methyltransferase